ncbi:MAG: hypothetical protein HGA96_11475 [Desulfobulbaceae bacterium]|nr:hypothetical protein [Desulfobulbaceae bacterium]
MNNSGSAEKKWYENYLPFVAKSPKIQAEWLASQLTHLRASEGAEGGGVLSRDEIKPYIRLLLESSNAGQGWSGEGEDEQMVGLVASMGEDNLLLLLECAEVYDVPKLFNLIKHPTQEMAIIAMKKVPPPYEKTPLLIIDRVFHAIREKSGELLEQSAVAVMAAGDAPAEFADNYDRFKEIMMDEHILSLLYPKAK